MRLFSIFFLLLVTSCLLREEEELKDKQVKSISQTNCLNSFYEIGYKVYQTAIPFKDSMQTKCDEFVERKRNDSSYKGTLSQKEIVNLILNQAGYKDSISFLQFHLKGEKGINCQAISNRYAKININ